MVYEAEAGSRRWLLKAVRESAGELLGQFGGVSEQGLRYRPAVGEWSLKEVAAHVRDAEVLYQRQIDLAAHGREPHLPYEAIDVLPFERDYREDSLSLLLAEYADAREETVWILRELAAGDWQRCGIHPYRGRVSVEEIARELHQHDLEHLYQAQRLHAAVQRL